MKIYLVSTPIGNYDDITLRALNTLKNSDLIVCEEYREARRLLSNYKIEKPLLSLNEHNEKETAEEIVANIKNGKVVSVISDCGTPLFSEPGHYLIEICIADKIQIIPIPGAVSIIPALIASGLDIEKFYYYGWLSPKKEVRKQELVKLKTLDELIILLDTPYRLKNLIESIIMVFGKNVPLVLAYQLTQKDEMFFRGDAEYILSKVIKQNLKGEFVLLLNNRSKRYKYKRSSTL
ncbi:MAG: 16S rRNA (cytidine(1402)-2'-O)-methyltransferase [Ignavibacteriaceae bacterium]|nr:16S rRNA (cytidine(1402)-2'-O)-methyltransferase [Ignavibacteriaceae bacterium]